MATWLTLLLLASLVAYASNRFSLQSVSLALIGALAVLYAFLPGTPAPTQAFTGFASEALVAIVGLMVLGRVLIMTGAMSPVSLLLSGALEHYPKAAFAAVLLGGFAMSGFLNDTPVVLLLIPLLVGAAERAGSNAARMLLPMNYAVILGGMMTAIGTSTNLLVSALSGSAGGPSWLLRLLPDRTRSGCGGSRLPDRDRTTHPGRPRTGARRLGQRALSGIGARACRRLAGGSDAARDRQPDRSRREHPSPVARRARGTATADAGAAPRRSARARRQRPCAA
ncbi:MAG: SLC13 family permease [Burkholderiaceae bacterium]